MAPPANSLRSTLGLRGMGSILTGQNRSAGESLRLPDQGAGNHVMQRLFAFREGRHDESDVTHHARQYLGKEATCGAAKRNSVPFHVSHLQLHDTFPDR